MTTIACDGKTLAADCQVTGGGQIVGYHDKVKRAKDGRIFAACGPSDEAARFAAWMDDDKASTLSLTDDFAALILNANGDIHWIGKTLEPVKWVAPAGLGSGGDIALGAMMAGKDPASAVQIASARDVGTGGGVTWMGLDDEAFAAQCDGNPKGGDSEAAPSRSDDRTVAAGDALKELQAHGQNFDAP